MKVHWLHTLNCQLSITITWNQAQCYFFWCGGREFYLPCAIHVIFASHLWLIIPSWHIDIMGMVCCLSQPCPHWPTTSCTNAIKTDFLSPTEWVIWFWFICQFWDIFFLFFSLSSLLQAKKDVMKWIEMGQGEWRVTHTTLIQGTEICILFENKIPVLFCFFLNQTLWFGNAKGHPLYLDKTIGPHDKTSLCYNLGWECMTFPG